MSAVLSLGSVGFAKQSALGVSAAPAYWGMFTADGSGPDVSFQEVYNGLHRSLAQAQLTQFAYKIDNTFYGSTDVLGELLLLAMGGTDTVSGTAAPYTHTLSQALGNIPYVTFQRSFAYAPSGAVVSGGMYAENMTDSQVSSLQLTGKAGELVMAKLAGMAGNLRQAVPVAPTFDTALPFTFWNGSLAMTISGGAVTAGVTSFDFTYDNQVEQAWKMGKVLPAATLPKVRKVGGSLEVLVENMNDYYRTAYGITVGADPTPTVKNGTFALNMSTANGVNTDTLALSMPKTYYKVVSVNLDPTGKILIQKIDFASELSAGNDELSAVLTKQTNTPY